MGGLPVTPLFRNVLTSATLPYPVALSLETLSAPQLSWASSGAGQGKLGRFCPACFPLSCPAPLPELRCCALADRLSHLTCGVSWRPWRRRSWRPPGHPRSHQSVRGDFSVSTLLTLWLFGLLQEERVQRLRNATRT